MRQQEIIALGILGILATAGLAFFLSIWQILAVVLSIVFFIITVFHPRWTLIFLLIWMPLEPFLLKFVPDVLYLYARYFSEGLIYFIVLTIVLKIGIGQKRWKQTPLDLPFLLFLLTVIASAALNFVEPTVAVLGMRQILRFVILFFAIVLLYPPREFIRKAVVVMFVMVLIQSVLGITQALAGGALDPYLLPSERRVALGLEISPGVEEFWEPGSRVFATMGRYDQLGTFLTFFLLLAVGFLYQRDVRLDRRELWFVLALGVPALLLTFSRSSWFGFVIGFLLIGLWFMRDRRVLAGLLAFVILVSGYLAYSGIVVPKLIESYGVRQTFVERFFETFSYERWRSEYYGFGRLYFIVQTPLKVVKAAPIFGHGPGQYGGGAARTLYNTRVYDNLDLPFGVQGKQGVIDNNWFSIWGEAGTLGLLFYVWMFGALFFAAQKVAKWSTDPLARGLALGFCGVMLAVALNAFLATMLEVRTLAIYLWVFGAFVVVLGRRQKIV